MDLGDAADVPSILIDPAQRETMNQSAGFARLLGREALALLPAEADFHRMAQRFAMR